MRNTEVPQLQNRVPGPTDGWMAEMSAKAGDVKTVWNRDNEDEIAAARAQFDSLKAKGYLAFRCNANGDKGEQIREFDPTAEAIILTPPLKGG